MIHNWILLQLDVIRQLDVITWFLPLFIHNQIKWTNASKINGTPKGVSLPISKPHSILAVANLLAHNNIIQICYYGQILLQSAAINCSFSDNITPLGGGVTFILLAMVQVELLAPQCLPIDIN